MRIIIATKKTWNIRLANGLKNSMSDCLINLITDEKDLNLAFLNELQPDYIFFPHWSSIIPKKIYENYECVVFHMTDLPFGRGGSPLQNLIVRGIDSTVISAIRVTKVLDGGDVYLKRPISLHGSAEEIYMRASEIIFGEMIPHILENRPVPTPQIGTPTDFKRRTPKMSELRGDMTEIQIFDHIRMLDAEGYPPAFLCFGDYVFKFSRAKRTESGIIADVLIQRRDDDEE